MSVQVNSFLLETRLSDRLHEPPNISSNTTSNGNVLCKKSVVGDCLFANLDVLAVRIKSRLFFYYYDLLQIMEEIYWIILNHKFLTVQTINYNSIFHHRIKGIFDIVETNKSIL